MDLVIIVRNTALQVLYAIQEYDNNFSRHLKIYVFRLWFHIQFSQKVHNVIDIVIYVVLQHWIQIQTKMKKSSEHPHTQTHTHKHAHTHTHTHKQHKHTHTHICTSYYLMKIRQGRPYNFSFFGLGLIIFTDDG